MKSYLLTIFLSLPFLMAGPLENSFSTPPRNLQGEGGKNISRLSPEQTPVEIQEVLVDGNEVREEEESLHPCFTPASVTDTCCCRRYFAYWKLSYRYFPLPLQQSHAHPYNKAPPV